MTIEEKRKRLDELCHAHKPLCSDNGACPLYCRVGLNCDSTIPEDIEFMYDLAFGTSPSEPDVVNQPPHYTQGNIQCIDAMESAFGKEAVATWCKLNAFKYIWREQHKNGLQDIDKAIWYLNKYKELSA